jgi:hypothetical protein
MVNVDHPHMPWVVSKIDEALDGEHPARRTPSSEAITDLNMMLDSEHSSIIAGYVARALRGLLPFFALAVSAIARGPSDRAVAFYA